MLCLFGAKPPSPPLPQPLATTDLLSVYDSICSGEFLHGNRTTWGLLCLASLMQHDISKILVTACVTASFLFMAK